MSFPPGLVVELGGGERPLFPLNVDLRPIRGKVQVVASVEALPFRDGVFSGVFGSYVLEHVGWRKIRQVAAEIYRVLKSFGVAVLFLPNTEEQCRAVVERRFGEDWDRYSEMLFGSQNYPEESHKSFWCPDMARRLFFEAGFGQVSVWPHPETPTDMVVECVKFPR